MIPYYNLPPFSKLRTALNRAANKITKVKKPFYELTISQSTFLIYVQCLSKEYFSFLSN